MDARTSQGVPHPRSAAPSRPPIALGVLLLVALAIGIAATFLSAPIQPVPPSTTSYSSGPTLSVIAEAVFVLFALGVGVLLVSRLFSGGSPGQSRIALMALQVFVVAVVFLALAHFVSNGGDLGVLKNATNASGGSPPPGNGTTNTTNLTFGPLPIARGLPGWVLYLGLAIAGVVAVIVIVPLLQARRASGTPEAAQVGPVRRTIEDALRTLELQGAADARVAVIALYARLLQTISPYLEHVDSATPREIERECIVRLHFQPANAQALTRLFEEARYSTHPFSQAQVDRARSALEAVLADLRTHPEPR